MLEIPELLPTEKKKVLPEEKVITLRLAGASNSEANQYGMDPRRGNLGVPRCPK
jgi:hypothetical protein